MSKRSAITAVAPHGTYDVAVIGGGVNGLSAAALAAQGGLRVLLVEAGEKFGGSAQTRSFGDGASVSAVAHLVSHLDPQLIKALDLYKHGLTYTDRRVPTVLLDPDGPALTLSQDAWQTRASLDAGAPQDTARYEQACREFDRWGAWLAEASAGTRDAADRKAALTALLSAGEGAGSDDLQRALIGSPREVFGRHFESPLLQGGFSYLSIAGSTQAPGWIGALPAFCLARLGECGGVRGGQGHPAGGMGRLAEALATAARTAGATLRSNVAALRIGLGPTGVEALELDTGETYGVRAVISTLSLPATFLGLLEPGSIGPEMGARLRARRPRGTCAKVHIQMEGPLEIRGVPDEGLGGRFLLNVAPEALELSRESAKHGDYPEAPAIDFLSPSVHDTGLAPEGTHVISAIVSAVPYDPDPPAADRQALIATVTRELSQVIPHFADSVLSAECLLPADIEAEYGLAAGDWHQGPLSLTRALLGPDPEIIGARTPVPGLFVGGVAAAPFGAVSGRPGREAAQAALAYVRG